MARKPVVKGDEAVRALRRAGFLIVRITGSHHHMRRPEGGPLVTVPCHAGQDLRPKTLKSILAQAGMSVEEFRALL